MRIVNEAITITVSRAQSIKNPPKTLSRISEYVIMRSGSFNDLDVEGVVCMEVGIHCK